VTCQEFVKTEVGTSATSIESLQATITLDSYGGTAIAVCTK